jgi:gliding motility-associated transport system ATP-binding protein
VIAAHDLAKQFGAVRALAGVSFRVARGEVVGFLGPNGAGKTTTLRILAGFLAADAGRALVDDRDPALDPIAVKRRVGYLPEGAPLYPDMRVGDYLRYRGRLKHVPRRALAAEVDRVLARARVADVRGRVIGQLSRGYRQRVGLADALLGEPPVLLLDEPTAGLDPNQIREVRELVRELARERTVLLSSHNLAEVEAVAARVVVLVAGRVAAEGTPAELRARGAAAAPEATPVRVRVRVRVDDIERARAALATGGAEATVVDAAAGRLRAALPPDEVARRLVAAGCALVEIAPEERSLEEVFAELTGGREP